MRTPKKNGTVMWYIVKTDSDHAYLRSIFVKGHGSRRQMLEKGRGLLLAKGTYPYIPQIVAPEMKPGGLDYGGNIYPKYNQVTGQLY